MKFTGAFPYKLPAPSMPSNDPVQVREGRRVKAKDEGLPYTALPAPPALGRGEGDGDEGRWHR